MKIRSGFVSNSSSSSFLIHNWFDLSPRKRKYIKNYDSNALRVWEKHKVPYVIEFWEGASKKSPFKGKVFHPIGWPGEEEGYSFGCLNDLCRWYFTENKKDNTCRVATTQDNFWMEQWLKHNDVDFEEERFMI